MDLSGAIWRKSSYSGSQSNCIEVADLDHVVAVRDSKDPAGPALTFSPGAWASFVATVKSSKPDGARVRGCGTTLHPNP